MIIELDHVICGHFKGRFVAKNSNMTPEWREWMCGSIPTLSSEYLVYWINFQMLFIIVIQFVTVIMWLQKVLNTKSRASINI